MSGSAVAALLGGAVLAFVVRVFNVVVVKLSAVLDVEAPEPIPDPAQRLTGRHPDH